MWSRCGLPLRSKRCAPGCWRGSAPGFAGEISEPERWSWCSSSTGRGRNRGGSGFGRGGGCAPPDGGSPSFASAPKPSIREAEWPVWSSRWWRWSPSIPRPIPNRRNCGNVSRPVSGPATWCGFGLASRHRPETAFEVESVLARSGWPVEGGENPRPLRLLAFPEPVGVERISDDPLQPPAVLRRKGGRPVRLRHARGPERIALEWWCDGKSGSEDEGSPAGRDYWRVETEGGARLWLYRELHPGAAGRWFLHGLFP